MDLEYNPALANMGNPKPVRAADLDTKTLTADQENTIYAKQVNNDKLLFFGYGGMNRNGARTKFRYFKALASGNGTGTAGDEIEGDLVAAITDSDQRRVIASVTLGSLSELADAEADDRTERPVAYALAPYAKPGRHIEYRIVPTSTSDGVELDTDASAANLWHSEVSN